MSSTDVVYKPTTDPGFPLAAIIGLSIVGYLALVITFLGVRKFMLQQGKCSSNCNDCCTGESCKEFCQACDEACSCCRLCLQPKKCLDLCCPNDKHCQCCKNLSEVSDCCHCPNVQFCECVQCCQLPQCDSINCLCCRIVMKGSMSSLQQQQYPMAMGMQQQVPGQPLLGYPQGPSPLLPLHAGGLSGRGSPFITASSQNHPTTPIPMQHIPMNPQQHQPRPLPVPMRSTWA